MEEKTTNSLSKSATVDIIQGISEREERDAQDLPPLDHSTVPDALERLATSNGVYFEYGRLPREREHIDKPARAEDELSLVAREAIIAIISGKKNTSSTNAS